MNETNPADPRLHYFAPAEERVNIGLHVLGLLLSIVGLLALVTLSGPVGWVIFAISWGMAVTGIVLKLFFTGRCIGIIKHLFEQSDKYQRPCSGPRCDRGAPCSTGNVPGKVSARAPNTPLSQRLPEQSISPAPGPVATSSNAIALRAARSITSAITFG